MTPTSSGLLKTPCRMSQKIDNKISLDFYKSEVILGLDGNPRR